jgi:hypothetical protein
MYITRYSCRILKKLEFSRQIFEIYSSVKFHENVSSGKRIVPCGRTDRHDEANSRSSQICERALYIYIYIYIYTCLPLKNAHKHCHVSTVIFISGTQKLSFFKITFTTRLVFDYKY